MFVRERTITVDSFVMYRIDIRNMKDHDCASSRYLRKAVETRKPYTAPAAVTCHRP